MAATNILSSNITMCTYPRPSPHTTVIVHHVNTVLAVIMCNQYPLLQYNYLSSSSQLSLGVTRPPRKSALEPFVLILVPLVTPPHMLRSLFQFCRFSELCVRAFMRVLPCFVPSFSFAASASCVCVLSCVRRE